MPYDPSIREQGYQYFLQEAPELLQVLGQGLLSLREDHSINQVNTLMRVTHTLKGAASSVGLETIATVAHSFEDVFKALCRVDVDIDQEVEILLFQGFECFRCALEAEMTGVEINQADVLDRTNTIFRDLREKLSDSFSQPVMLPTSAELGFDVTRSIFDHGVAPRLERLTGVLANEPPQEIRTAFRAEAEVFMGIAESMNLSGFQAICQAVIAALDNHPSHAYAVAKHGLENFQIAYSAVLAGDRSQGGQPSEVLQHLASTTTSSLAPLHPASQSAGFTTMVLGALKGRLHKLFQRAESEATKPLLTNPGTTQTPANSLEGRSAMPAIARRKLGTAETSSIQSTTQPTAQPTTSPSLEPAANLGTTAYTGTDQQQLLETIWGRAIPTSPLGAELPIGPKTEILPETNPIDTRELPAAANLGDRELLPMGQRPEAPPTLLQSPSLPAHLPLSTLITDRTGQVTPPLNTSLRTLATSIISAAGLSAATPTAPAPSPAVEPPSPSSSAAFPTASTLAPAVRVNLEHLDQLNYAVGELLTHQNQQSLQVNQTQATVQTLYAQLQRHHQRLIQFQDWLNQQAKAPNPELPNLTTLTAPSQAQMLAQSLLDDMVQLTEVGDAIDLFTRQSQGIAAKQERLLAGARDALIEARMLPLSHILERFPPLLRKLETLHGKAVNLEVHGAEVMVDKAVVEKLYEPLLHLIRNAFDHGIEPISLRQQRSKPDRGQMILAAHNQGRHLVIQIQDDGNGLNLDLIRQRSVERGLISAQQAPQVSASQLIDLLFEPGFSTAAQVNDLSGRGMGLDIVKAQLKALRGSVTVQSQQQQGTIFTLKIPLSLTIAPMMLCRSGDRTYALLNDTIEQILIPKTGQVLRANGRSVLQSGNPDAPTSIPVRSLSQVLRYTSAAAQLTALQTPSLSSTQKPETHPIILLRAGDQRLGLEVDQLLGEQELVIRPLTTIVKTPDYVNGSSILADGQLTLVLDGTALLARLLRPVTDESVEPSDRSASHWERGFSAAPPVSEGTAAIADNPLPRSDEADGAASAPMAQLSLNLSVPPVAPSHPGPTPARKILIIEDSITVRQTLALTLQKAGYQVLQAEDGYIGMEQFQRHPDIQMVVCDLEMPRMTGFDFLQQRQQMPDLAGTPVIMLTSRNDLDHQNTASQLGASAYVTKPYMDYKLLSMIETMLAGERG